MTTRTRSSFARRPHLGLLGAAAALFFALPASAQDVQKGTGTGVDQATKGSTDITSEKFQTREKDAAEAKDATELSLSAGTLNSSGNSRLIAATSTAKFRLRREMNQFKSAAAANFARSAPPGGDLETTVQNFQGLTRYDRFLGDVSVFLSAQGRARRSSTRSRLHRSSTRFSEGIREVRRRRPEVGGQPCSKSSRSSSCAATSSISPLA